MRLIAAACMACALVGMAIAAERTDDGDDPQRPTVLFNRWQEDWSVLADPAVPHEALDNLKYIPLSSDPHTYLSLGANVRERYEYNDAVNFGTNDSPSQSYLLSRVETHADLRIAEQFQTFVQLQSDYAPGKTILTPVDQDRLDLEQAFIALIEPLADGTIKLRVGRQQIGFDLQRFVSVRDGPNVRQSYDAVWLDYERGGWRFITFLSHPVQDRDLRPFDDYSSSALTYGGVRVERRLGELGNLSAYLSQYTQDGAHFLTVSGNERRHVGDVRITGSNRGFDWDLEGMYQAGSIGVDNIRAWAIGSRSGYTLGNVLWQPRLGMQLDAASGDRNAQDHTLNTFNPLFPNGAYVTLSGYTGYTNFIHVKPSFTLKPTPRLTTMLAVAAQWRESTADAVYTQPDIPVAGTAGHGGAYSGTYYQLRTDWQMSEHFASALEAVRFDIADALRDAGAHDSTYVGVEVRFGW
jgi:hypothetical protein